MLLASDLTGGGHAWYQVFTTTLSLMYRHLEMKKLHLKAMNALFLPFIHEEETYVHIMCIHSVD